RDALGQFFETAEGRLEDFTFLDPADNLLRWSEDLTNPVWQRNALLQVAGGQLTNAGLAPLRIEQNVSGPGWFRYALSVSARGTGNERIGLFRATQTLEDLAVEDVGTAWKRYLLAGQFSTTEEGVRFGLQIEAGQSVEISGLQVEAQAAASVYKKTGARGGVYGQARFAEDGLETTAEGPSQHFCEARIVSRG
ncbi:MAG: hypothetical protein HY013_05275, partial [Candidatus Solibacter usitatus]|nr:hypothetical protein [Candidatus Solibacter usitatus]